MNRYTPNKPLELLSCLAALIVAFPLARAEESASTNVEATARTQALFDGESLKNWEIVDYAGHGEVHVLDESLVIEMGSTLSGVVWTGDELPTSNYEIRLEAKRVQGNDFFCGLTFPYRDKHASLIIGGWGGGLMGISSIDGMDASENETADYMRFEEDRWYKIRLRALPNQLEAWVDDRQIVDLSTKDRDVDLRIDIAEFTPLGLSTFQTVAALRNIRLIRLSETPDGK